MKIQWKSSEDKKPTWNLAKFSKVYERQRKSSEDKKPAWNQANASVGATGRPLPFTRNPLRWFYIGRPNVNKPRGPRKSLRIHANSCKSMKTHENLWTSMKIYETRWKSSEDQRPAWKRAKVSMERGCDPPRIKCNLWMHLPSFPMWSLVLSEHVIFPAASADMFVFLVKDNLSRS